MIVSRNLLPSRHTALDISNNTIEIKPLVFSEIIKLFSVQHNSSILKYLRDILMLEGDLDFKSELMYDLDYLIFLKKFTSISSTLDLKAETKCPKCNEPKEIDIQYQSFKFYDKPDFSSKNKITLPESKVECYFKMPTINEYVMSINNISKYPSIPLELIKLIALFDPKYHTLSESIKLIESSTRSDIIAFFNIEYLYLRTLEPIQVACTACKTDEHEEVWKVESEMMYTDFFRGLFKNSTDIQVEVLP